NIGEYLPESAWEVANKRKMVITLHMVKEEALANEDNMNYICSMAKKYPDAVLILAHAARSFAAWTGIENVEKLAHIENVCFDFSAICETPAMFQIVKKAGIKRCMWGSDYPVCRGRGKAISIADSFYWIYENDINNFSSKTPVRNWLIGIEGLAAARQLSILADLTEGDIEDYFFNNAMRLFYR
ncbi:MAG: amidohydrolase family protein, partial [Clostridia bacterium]|nr:amidohydrolase family protein [Clostridia bacterium]